MIVRQDFTSLNIELVYHYDTKFSKCSNDTKDIMSCKLGALKSFASPRLNKHIDQTATKRKDSPSDPTFRCGISFVYEKKMNDLPIRSPAVTSEVCFLTNQGRQRQKRIDIFGRLS